MKFFRFLLALTVTITFVILLNSRIGQVPPLGRFMNPFKGFWQNAELENQTPELELSLSGLQDSVQVIFDEYLIPHIYAENLHDLYFTQGYVTAQHRLWQMEFQVLAAAGSVSEIIGKDALQFDRLQRRKGLVYAAKNAMQEIKKDSLSKMALDAYAKGVNHYINSLNYKQLPLEYKLLDYKPEKWTPLKTALLLKFMANDLSYSEKDLENTNALKIWGKDTFNLLFPEIPEGLDPVISKKNWNFQPEKIEKHEVKIPEQFAPIKEYTLHWNLFEQDNEIKGSNNWAISGSKTASGNPILANDPHLGLRLPSIWYIAHLNTPQMNVMGATLPGAPAVISGFSDSIAWGVTNAKRDVKDWYAIQFKNEDIRNQYAYDNKWLRTEKSIEKIIIRGAQDFTDTIIYTHYGPVVYDKYFKKSNIPQNFALRWTAHEPSNEMLAFIKLNLGDNYNDYVEALSHYQSPAQNFAFAAANGDIALWIQGKFVNKWPEQGKFLMDGSTSSQEWQGFIPQHHNAHIKNPERGFVSSANQYPVHPSYPYYVYDYRYENYRNKRINQRLKEMQNITFEDVMKLQNDNFSWKAYEALPFMLKILSNANLNTEEQRAFDELQKWNYMDAPEQKMPSVFDTWRKSLSALLWDDFATDSLALYTPDWHTTLNLMKTQPNLEFYDIINTPEKEVLSDLVTASFKETIQKLYSQKKENQNLNWGDFKPTLIQHLARLPSFSVSDISVGGNRNVVNANYGNHGVSWRLVVEMGDTIKAWGIYPGGQSGNPGSYYYSNMIKDWSKGEYIPLNFFNDRNTTLKKGLFTQTLKP
jgi:penicillin G amidase